MIKKIFLSVFAMASAFVASAAVETVTSPDKHIVLTFSNDGDVPSYSVAVDGMILIADSKLGIVASNWNYNPTGKIKVKRSSKNEKWTQPWGENKECRNHYKEMLIQLADGQLAIRFRLFNDGVGFRYELNAPVDTLVVTDELTQFAFASDGESWSIPANFETYELEYRHLPMSKVSDANTPFTFRTESGVYGSVHEAALYDYPEMVLRRDSISGILKADLSPLPNGVKAYVPGLFNTPWRTIQVADKAVGLINSSLILNLNEPSKIKDTSWIEPQKYVGIWWGMHLGTQTWTMGLRHGATTENAIKYIDFAAENNIQGVLFEGWNQGWENWGGNQHFDYLKAYEDFSIDSIAAYARSRGIDLWMHNETGGNIPEYEAVLDSVLAYYASLGVRTLKTGYAGGFKGGYLHHSQYGVKHYQRVVEAAARYGIMINAHEPIKDTGIRRTWPNMMTREGARGMEWNAWSKGNSADYLSTLPFVRMLSGPMDYTPGIFDVNYDRAKADTGRIEWNGPNADCCIKTTLARQIANWVIIYSPLQMASDQIENYIGHPAFKFFRDYEADCDWSEALQGEIGEYIVVARRAGKRYFVGAGTNSEARIIELPLDFLEKGVKYTVYRYADVEGAPENVAISSEVVDSSMVLTLSMSPSGGQAISFIPIEAG